MANSPKLQSVLDAAQKASENFSPPATVEPETNTALTQSAPAGTPQKMTLDQLADNSGMTVDSYLTVKEAGFRAGDGTPYFQTFKGVIDLTEVAVIGSIRSTKNGATQFFKTYDSVTVAGTGQSFAQAEQNSRATADKTDVYTTVEVPVLLLEDVPGLEAGKRIGVTPSITGVKLWNAFYDKVRKAGLSEAKVEVQLTCKPQKNKKGNEWGIAEFVLLGEADEDGE